MGPKGVPDTKTDRPTDHRSSTQLNEAVLLRVTVFERPVCHPGSPNSKFHTLLCCFMANAWKCAKTSPLKLGDKRTGCCNTYLTLPFSPGNFLPKATLLSPDHPTHLTWSSATFLFPAILTQIRWLRQNRTWCWTHSQNTTSSMHLKNDRRAGNSAYAWRGTTLRVKVTNRPKVSFRRDGSNSTGNYEWLSAIFYLKLL
jgi:hypothetical protein